jgi:predicted metal-dependent peptidase
MDDLWPGADEGRPEAEMEQAREWGQRLMRAHAGDGAFSMLRALLADLPKVRTPWEHLLRTHLTRGLSLKPGLSWSRPSRSYLANRGRVGQHGRLPWEPGRTAAQAVARLVVMVDCSGSIESPLLDRFAQEVESVTRRLEARVVVIIGDDRVTGVEVFEPGRSNLRDVVFQGGGGTDFTPLLREADRHRPDLGLFLTDLQGPADFRPRWPVLWAVPIAWADAEPPFGRKLVLG